MSALRPMRIRARLTLWYTGVLAAILMAAGAAVSVLLLHEFRDLLTVHAIEQLETDALIRPRARYVGPASG